ncbi:MAG: type II toxin-antitoxin system PemK/MazF family toxin [Candidatus Lloydbacteria bacterium]|nr:type II toxin-antitoxin system PemK/MazF family toxin [Candidatus Lloydbacteria bacterium]
MKKQENNYSLKNFDVWNDRKKNIHKNGLGKLYSAREVWWCSLGINIGFEQDGTGKDNERPVLVMKGFSRQVCLIIPLTTSTKKNPYHVAIGEVDGKNAFAIISQIRLVDTKRLINKIGFIDKDLFDKIRKTVKDML